MKPFFQALALATIGIATATIQSTAFAEGPHANRRHDFRWRGGEHNRQWDASENYRPRGRDHDRRMMRNDDLYRGHDGRYYCRRSDGTTGLVIGALGGGLLGNAIGGNTLGTLLGAGSGALIGQSIDRGEVHCR